MALLTVYARSASPVFANADVLGDEFVNNGQTELFVSNVGVASIDVTVNAVRECSHGFIDDEVVTCDPGELTPLGPFDASRFNSSLGRVSISYSDTSGITVAARRQR